ncbi:hydrogenase maturation nickel metallochaperone HypA/HybF [Paractinoplanes brasiliensis]|uniref:Hydrogenase maturation factor HypA n=1 Tax=Paractinoplanes brasiliensis TaxID=52695 RepID=A0A4R6JPY2_9ACTN|nr:hydrogenase maturation nickel metallochaperone HypA [Actinoplanes brasiliensis]MDY7086096.1 hydrogenase maturation nickel metallochaperone HypA [Actinomycetota bacterium]TDO36896.1 hydrogenase-3 nickel incorporation protein HypA [Actinoplanes brasiliensis]GID30416.1 hydrogenase nickel incorporation protein HypA [Actinoplanes brasiliensis]
MHELSIAESVVAAVCERAGDRRVHSVRMRIGAFTAVVPDAMQFCFGLAVEGTVADGARLDIEHRPGAVHCRACGADTDLADMLLLCPCGSADVAVTAGRELQIVSMEVG